MSVAAHSTVKMTFITVCPKQLGSKLTSNYRPFSKNGTLFYGKKKKVGTAAPSKQTSLWRSRHDLVSLGVKDTESWRGWVMKRRDMGRRVRMGGIVEEVG